LQDRLTKELALAGTGWVDSSLATLHRQHRGYLLLTINFSSPRLFSGPPGTNPA